MKVARQNNARGNERSLSDNEDDSGRIMRDKSTAISRLGKDDPLFLQSVHSDVVVVLEFINFIDFRSRVRIRDPWKRISLRFVDLIEIRF